MSSTTEVKHCLRKLEFPICAKEALIKIGDILISRSSSIKHMDLAMDLMSEFVFCELDRRGNKHNLTSLQHLQLVEILYNYFSDIKVREQTKNTVFLSLFGGASLSNRVHLLCKLVSLSVCVQCVEVLTAAGLWMQQLGNTSTHSVTLAESLLEDFLVLVPTAAEKFQQLPKITPHFTANLLAAIAHSHLNAKSSNSTTAGFTPPDDRILFLIVDWVSADPHLCLAAVCSSPTAALPLGAIQMPPVSPLAGLFKWCILAPLQLMHLKQNTTERLFQYEKLHLALLESLLVAAEPEPETTPGIPALICAQHLATAISALQGHIALLLKEERAIHQEPMLSLSLERLAQAVQVAIASHCMYGNIQGLISQMDQLPNNRLLRIVLTANKEIVI